MNRVAVDLGIVNIVVTHAKKFEPAIGSRQHNIDDVYISGSVGLIRPFDPRTCLLGDVSLSSSSVSDICVDMSSDELNDTSVVFQKRVVVDRKTVTSWSRTGLVTHFSLIYWAVGMALIYFPLLHQIA